MPEQPFIAVVGTGVATGIPDQCKLQFALHCMTDSAAEALATSAELASRAITALGEVDVEQSDIRTVGLSLQDFFDKGEQRVTGRIGTYRLEVSVQPVDGVGSILNALGSSVGDSLQIQGIQLSIRDPEPLRSEARRLAVQDAQKKAVELSQAAGIQLGRLLALEDDAAHRGSSARVARSFAAAAAPGQDVPIEPGQVSAVSSVVMTYEIESGGGPLEA